MTGRYFGVCLPRHRKTFAFKSPRTAESQGTHRPRAKNVPSLKNKNESSESPEMSAKIAPHHLENPAPSARQSGCIQTANTGILLFDIPPTNAKRGGISSTVPGMSSSKKLLIAFRRPNRASPLPPPSLPPSLSMLHTTIPFPLLWRVEPRGAKKKKLHQHHPNVLLL